MSHTSPRDRAPAGHERTLRAPQPRPLSRPLSRPLPEPQRPSRRRPPQNASWACIFSVDLLSRRFFVDVVLPMLIVLMLVAAVAGAIGLTYVAL